MSDMSVQRIIENDRLKNEIKELKYTILIAKICILILGIFLFVSIWICSLIANKIGYEDAVEDFYNGKLKCERIEKNGKVKYIWEEKK